MLFPRHGSLLRIGALFLLLAHAPSTYAAVYKCVAKDGNATYSDAPCDQNAQVIEVTPEPLHSKPNASQASPSTAPLDATHPAGLCGPGNFAAWMRSQNPAPSAEQRRARTLEMFQKCRNPASAQHTLTSPPAPSMSMAASQSPVQTLATQAGAQQPKFGLQSPLTPSAAPIVSAGANPPQRRTTWHPPRLPSPPRVSSGQLFALSALIVVTTLMLLTSLTRVTSRFRMLIQWILDKLLRLGTALVAVVCVPLFFIVGIMANDADTATGKVASLTIIGIGALVVLFSLWLTFGFRPRRNSPDDALPPWYAVGFVMLYTIGAAGWTLGAFWTMLHFQ